jgi:hypothetical protein
MAVVLSSWLFSLPVNEIAAEPGERWQTRLASLHNRLTRPRTARKLPSHVRYGIYDVASQLGDMCLSLLQIRNVYCGIEHVLLPIDE